MNSSTVTIIIPVSRKEYLDQVFSALEMLDTSGIKTNILVGVDSSDPGLFLKTRNLVEESRFSERLCIKLEDINGDVNNVFGRRERISSIHNKLRKELRPLISKNDIVHYIFGVEDDTLIPTDSLKKLMNIFATKQGVGFAEGVELGRWGSTYVGGWRADDIYNPSKITSLSDEDISGGVQEIDSGGFYCFLTKLETYLEHDFEPFDNNGLGPDANFGISLRRNGYSNFIDTSIQCAHLKNKEKIIYPKNKIQQIEMIKIGKSWNSKIIKK